MSGHDLSNYIEVPERIVQFKEAHPDGSLQGSHRLVSVGDRQFIEYVARAYRTPDDPRPGVGTTWEPYPGTTSFTRNSEVENAETSAWGRALAALGFVSKRDGTNGVATANEVRNRSAERAPDGGPNPSKKQHELIKSLVSQKGVTTGQLEQIVGEITLTENVVIDEGWVNRLLTGGRDGSASVLIDRLMKGPIPPAADPITPEPDAGAGEEFVHPPAGDTDDVPFSEAA